MLWINTYRRLLATAPEDACFISYERLCRDTAVEFRRIASAVKIDCDADSYDGFFQEADAKPVSRFSAELAERAAEVREELFRRSAENAAAPRRKESPSE